MPKQVHVEPLGENRYALVVDGVTRHVAHSAEECHQRAKLLKLEPTLDARSWQDEMLGRALRRT